MSGLAAKRVVVTRAREQASAMCDLLTARGAQPIVFPAIQIAPMADTTRLDQAIANLARYDWLIFTSANGVTAFWERLTTAGAGADALAGVRLAAIGPVTAHALAERGAAASFVPEKHVAEAIAAGLGARDGQRILLAQAEIARDVLAEALRRLGASVDEVAVYRTLPAEPDPHGLAELRRGVDAITFTSASTVDNFLALIGNDQQLTQAADIACIGPITSQAARAAGLRVDVQPAVYTAEALVAALAEHFAGLGQTKETQWKPPPQP